MATATASGKPRFKQELVAELIEDGGARFIDVMDPDSGNIFRFYEVEYALACAMDGERDVAGIVKWAQEELGVTPTPSEVTSVIATLGNLGYLAGAGEAAVEHKDELARGIVVPRETHTPVASGMDIALGPSGSDAPRVDSQSPIDTGDFALGKPGAPPVAPLPAMDVEDVPLGGAGASTRPITTGDSIPTQADVSLDLSENMPIGLGDVKEAVRASKVMSAVEVPPELLAALGEDKPGVEAKPEPKVEPKVEKKPEPVIAKAEPKPEPKVEKKPEPKVEKKPEAVGKAKPEPKRPEPKPVVEAKQPVAPEAKRTSPVLIVLLVLVLLGGAGFVVWKYVLNKPSEATDTVTQGSASVVAPGPGSAITMAGSGSGSGSGSAAVAEVVELTSKLVADAPINTDLKPLAPGAIEWVGTFADGKVKKGDVIVKMTGAKKLDDEAVALTHTIEREQKALDQATKDKAAAGADAAAVTKADDKIKDKTASIAKNNEALTAKKAELEKLEVIAAADGKVTISAKVGDRTGDTVAKLAGEAALVASFATKTAPAVGATVTLTRKSDAAALACAVTESTPEGFKASCDPSKAKADDEVTYKP